MGKGICPVNTDSSVSDQPVYPRSFDKVYTIIIFYRLLIEVELFSKI